jgi:hypothetical protein
MKYIRMTKNCGVRPNSNKYLRKAMCIPTLYTKKGTISETTITHSCREIIIGEFAKKVNYLKNNPPIKRYKTDYSFSRVIIMGLTKEQDKDPLRVRSTLNAVNAIEREIGWELTRVDLIKQPKNEVQNKVEQYGNALVYTGDKRWFRSSQIMSLWLLLIRHTLDNKDLNLCQDMEDVWLAVRSASSLIATGGSPSPGKDRAYLKKIYKIIIPLLKNLDKYFDPNIPIEDRFNKKKIYEGINVGHNLVTYLPNLSTDGILNFAIKKSKHPACAKFFQDNAV